MKKIECIIRSERLEELKTALIGEGVGGMTISDVRGFGKEQSRPDGYLVLPKIKVEIYASDDQVDNLVAAIMRVCRKNSLGDGKIVILPIVEIVRIRTGERSLQAIY